MNQNANFGASLSSTIGIDTYYDSGDGTNSWVNLVPPTLFIRGYGLSSNVGSSRYTYSWVGANAIATTNQQQLSGISSTSTTVSNVWTVAITDTKTGQVVTPLPSYTQTYTAASLGRTKALFSSINPQPSGTKYYTTTVTIYNYAPNTYLWTFLVNQSGSTFVTPTASSTRTNTTAQGNRFGSVDVVQCAVTYGAGLTIYATIQLVWP